MYTKIEVNDEKHVHKIVWYCNSHYIWEHERSYRSSNGDQSNIVSKISESVSLQPVTKFSEHRWIIVSRTGE